MAPSLINDHYLFEGENGGKEGGWAIFWELLSLLRENQVKYCVDHEHFELGKVFVQSMVDSVYESRKVLAVWSDGYAPSRYCMQQLDYVIQHSFQNSDCSVIVIRLDRTDRKQLPKPPRAGIFLDYSDSVERQRWEKRLIAHVKELEQKNNVITTIVWLKLWQLLAILYADLANNNSPILSLHRNEIRLFAHRLQIQKKSFLQVLIFNRYGLRLDHVFLVFCFVLYGVDGDLTA